MLIYRIVEPGRKVRSRRHTSLSCNGYEEALKRFPRQALRFAKDSGCFHCLKPTRVCSGTKGPRNRCLGEGLLPAFLILLWWYREFYATEFPAIWDEFSLREAPTKAAFCQKFLRWEWALFNTEAMVGVRVFFEFSARYYEKV
jgi:hypothetical protein